MRFEGKKQEFSSLSWCFDGMKLLSGSKESSSVKVWDIDGETAFKLNGHSDNITSISTNSRNSLVSTTSFDNTVQLIYVYHFSPHLFGRLGENLEFFRLDFRRCFGKSFKCDQQENV
jgi:WD40 repeat protein